MTIYVGADVGLEVGELSTRPDVMLEKTLGDVKRREEKRREGKRRRRENRRIERGTKRQEDEERLYAEGERRRKYR
jgi:hypothetical protein